jgi:hypothetical protein
VQLRKTFEQADVSQSEQLGCTDSHKLVAELMLVRREMAAYPVPPQAQRRYILKDTIDPSTGKPVDFFICDRARKYYTAKFGEYIKTLPGDEPNRLRLDEEQQQEEEEEEGPEGDEGLAAAGRAVGGVHGAGGGAGVSLLGSPGSFSEQM